MSLEIKFSKSHSKYIAGDAISGKITIKNDVPIEATGLVVSLFMHSRISVSVNGHVRPFEATEPIMTQNLNLKFFENNNKAKSRILATATHPPIPFLFAPLAKDCPASCESAKTFCRYFVKAELAVKSKESINAKRNIKVGVLLLDDNPEALGWQTKSDSRFLKLSLKKISMEVTIPNGIATNETVPIKISISNNCKLPKAIIRSSINRSRSYPLDKTLQPTTIMINNSVEEFTGFRYELTHYLKVGTGPTFQSPLLSETYTIRVEMETEKSQLLFVEFPVIVGQWKHEPVRGKEPTTVLWAEQTPEPLNRLLSYLQQNQPPPVIPAHGLVTSVTPSAPPLTPVTAPSAPPMEMFGLAPPSYSAATMSQPCFLQPPQPQMVNVTLLKSPTPPPRSVKALFAYTADGPSELSFDIGQIIRNVKRSNEEGWLVGTIDGKSGLVPSNFVESLHSAQ